MSDRIKPRWAPRVPPRLIQRLYESDARGLLDHDLLDDVGIRLYLRCQSIIIVRTIMFEGRLPCPRCGNVITREGKKLDEDELLACDSCSWEMPWRSYWATFRNQELAYDTFISDYITDWERAKTPQAKMLAIDRLIHQWHNADGRTRPGYGVGRPSGVGLIEDSREQVIAFLNALTYDIGLAASSGNHLAWLRGLAEFRAVSRPKKQ